MRITIVLSFVGMILATSTGAPADTVALKESVPHITTLGEASAEVVPDQADIELGVSEQRATADEATQATAKTANDLIAEIKRRGIETRDIKTSFDLAAQYDEEQDERTARAKRTFRGYKSEEHISVRLHDVSKAGVLARALVDKGANEFAGVSYSYSKEAGRRQELRAEAIRNALVRGKAYTDAIGVKLGRVLQIGDDNVCGEQASMMSRRVASGTALAVAIPTEPGIQHLSETINVIWEIEGKVVP